MSCGCYFHVPSSRVGKVLDLTYQHRETVSMARTCAHIVETWLFNLKPGRQLVLRARLSATSSSLRRRHRRRCRCRRTLCCAGCRGESNHVPFLRIHLRAFRQRFSLLPARPRRVCIIVHINVSYISTSVQSNFTIEKVEKFYGI